MDIINDNPYRLLGVYANSPTKERVANESKLRAFLKVGKQMALPLDLPRFLPAINRTIETVTQAKAYLEKWREAVMKTSLTYIKKFVKTIKVHWSGVITNFTSPGVNNGILEEINQKIQLAKRRVRGFALISNFSLIWNTSSATN